MTSRWCIRIQDGFAVAISLLMVSNAPGVIVGGPNGDGLGNATESALQTYLQDQASPVFPFWNNLLRVSDSSGTYLGRNATTGRGWVLTAAHVTPLTINSGTITVAGQAYVVRETHIIRHPDENGTLQTDIRLYGIGGEPGDPALPPLPAIPILATDLEEGDELILTGRGRRRQVPTEDTVAPYEWDGDTSPANQLTRQIRWGSNRAEIFTPVAPAFLFDAEASPTVETTCFATAFDDPAGSGTAYEGQLCLLDSGGGAFVRRKSSWYLTGSNSYVDDGPDEDAVVSPSGYGDFSIMAHLPSYRAQIEAITGPLVPANSGPSGDLDDDGISNLLEYAFNLNPLVNEQVIMVPGSGTAGLPLIRVETIEGNDRLTIEFVRRTASGGITYTPQFSDDLQAWPDSGTETVTSIDTNWDRVKVVDSQPLSASPTRFARLKIEE